MSQTAVAPTGTPLQPPPLETPTEVPPPSTTPSPTRTTTPTPTLLPQPTVDSPHQNSKWTSYTNANYIRSLLVDKDGNLWAGGSGGVVFWELKTGKYIKYTSETGLAGNSVYAIAQSTDGAMWFGTSAGASRYRNGGWRTFTARDGLPGEAIDAIAATPDGAVWFGTGGKASRYDGYNWTIYDKPASALAVAPDGTIWAGGAGSVSHFDGLAWTTISYPAEQTDQYLVTDLAVNALAVDPSGTVWVGTDYALHRYNGKSWVTFNPWEKYRDVGVTALSVDPQGALWIGLGSGSQTGPEGTASPGVYQFDGSQWKLLTMKEGLLDNEVRAIAWGQDGDAYFGYYSQGISQFDGKHWTTFQMDDSLLTNAIDHLAVSKSGVVWLGSSYGVSQYDGKVWRAYTGFGGLRTDINAICIASDNSVWVSMHNGVAHFDGQKWIEYPAYENKWADSVQTMTSWPGGKLFFGGRNSSMIFDGQDWKAVLQLPSEEIIDVALALPDGTLWADGAGYPGGIYHYDGRTWNNLGDLIPSVSAIGYAPNGNIWFSSTLHGATRYDGERWVSFTENDGLPSNDVRSIAAGSDGVVWFGTSNGLARYDGHEWKTYTSVDGLADNFILDLAVSPDGTLWLATHAGLSHFMP